MRILFFLFDAIGDFIISTPFLENFRRAHPEAFIGAIGSRRNIKLLEKNPYINTAHVFDRANIWTLLNTIIAVRKTRYDILCDMFFLKFSTGQKILIRLAGAPVKIAVAKHSQYRQLRYKNYFDEIIPLYPGHQSQVYNNLLLRLGADPVSCGRPYSYALEDARLRQARRIMPVDSVNIVLVCEGSRRDNTLHPDCCRLLAQKLTAAVPRARIYLSASPGAGNPASRIAAELNSPMVTALPEISGELDFTAAVIARAALLISTSTGTLHIGGAFDVPTVGIYPPQQEHYWPVSSRKAIRLAQSCPEGFCAADADEIVEAARELLGETRS